LAALALSDWKAQSRIELLVARQRQQPTEANATEVRKLLVEQSDLRIKRKEIERDRAQAALARAETQLSKLKAEQSQWVEQQAKRLLRGLAKPKAGAKAETKARGDSK